jgi:hypothetical protein
VTLKSCILELAVLVCGGSGCLRSSWSASWTARWSPCVRTFNYPRCFVKPLGGTCVAHSSPKTSRSMHHSSRRLRCIAFACRCSIGLTFDRFVVTYSVSMMFLCRGHRVVRHNAICNAVYGVAWRGGLRRVATKATVGRALGVDSVPGENCRHLADAWPPRSHTVGEKLQGSR